MITHKQEWRKALSFDHLINRMAGAVEDKAPRPKHYSRSQEALIRDFSGATYLFAQNDPDVDIYFDPSEVSWGLLPRHFDTKFCTVQFAGDFDYSFLRVRQVSMKELRGLSYQSDKVVAVYYMGLRSTSKVSVKRLFELLPNGKWREIEDTTDRGWKEIKGSGGVHNYQRSVADTAANLEWSRVINAGLTIAFSDQYQWKVRLTNKTGMALQIACHPSNISKMFKLRDKYSDRKKALRHLVTAHWRNLSDVGDWQTFVRDHLRGTLQFEWFGLQCQVIVPTALKKDLKQKMAQREAMRIVRPRLDRRNVFASAAR